jgi:hypothetical protein
MFGRWTVGGLSRQSFGSLLGDKRRGRKRFISGRRVVLYDARLVGHLLAQRGQCVEVASPRWLERLLHGTPSFVQAFAMCDAYRPPRCPALPTTAGGAPLDRLGKVWKDKVRVYHRPSPPVWTQAGCQLLPHLLVLLDLSVLAEGDLRGFNSLQPCYGSRCLTLHLYAQKSPAPSCPAVTFRVDIPSIYPSAARTPSPTRTRLPGHPFPILRHGLCVRHVSRLAEASQGFGAPSRDGQRHTAMGQYDAAKPANQRI